MAAAEFEIIIEANVNRLLDGLNRIQDSLNRIDRQADTLRGTLSKLFSGAIIAAGIKEFLRLSDIFDTLQNRLRLVTENEIQLVRVTEELFDISQKTRVSLESTTELFSKTAIATSHLGKSQQELINFTKQLNQALILSGTSSQNAARAVIQLTQGMGKGRLDGDELRSVLENTTVVAEVLARKMGVVRTELKDLGAEGKITPQIILEAFSEMSDELETRFNKTLPTISQGIIVVRNSILKIVGDFNRMSGVSRALGAALVALSENIETLARVAAALAIVLGTQLAIQALGTLRTAIKALWTLIAANPLGALLVVLGSIVALLITFSDKINAGIDDVTTLRDVLVATWQIALEELRLFYIFFVRTMEDMRKRFPGVFDEFSISMINFIRFLAATFDDILGGFNALIVAIVAAFVELPRGLKEIFSRAMNGIIGIVEEGINGMIGLINSLFDVLKLDKIPEVQWGKVFEVKPGEFDRIKEDMSAAIREALDIDISSSIVESIVARAQEISKARELREAKEANLNVTRKATAAKTKENKAFAQALKLLDRELMLLQLDSKEREIQRQLLALQDKAKRNLTKAEKDEIDTKLRLVQAMKDANSIYEDIKQPVIEYQNAVKNLNSLLVQGKISQLEFNQAMKDIPLVSELTGIERSLLPDTDQQLAILQDSFEQQKLVLDQAREAELRSAEEHKALLLEIEKKHALEVQKIENAQLALRLSSAKTVFGDLATITKNYAGEQSSTYKALFAISKAFAIAEASVNISTAISKALALGWPQNIPEIAKAISIGASIISDIQSASLAFRNGGSMTVGGSGGPDSQLVSFRASPNETISVRTPGQEMQARRQEANNMESQQPAINIVNVTDPSLLGDFLESPAGEQSFINIMQRNSNVVQSIANGG
jgi:tape measure domain-containing protein